MDRSKSDSEYIVSKKHIDELTSFLKTFSKLSQSERVNYIKNKFSEKEINFFSEIASNFLRGNIKTDSISFKHLKRIKQYIYKLASNKTAKKYKHQLLSSLKGLQILNLLIPLTIQTLLNKSCCSTS